MVAEAQRAVAELLPLNAPNKNVFVVAPTYDDVIDLYYPLFAEHWDCYGSEREGKFKLPNKTNLRLLSYEAIERMRGKGAYFVAIDEPSSCRNLKAKWEGVIEPCITTRWSPQMARKYGAPTEGRALFVGTPKGFNFLYDLFNYKDEKWASWQFDYTHSPFLDAAHIESLRHRLDPVEFASEYLAAFKESGSGVFHTFSRKHHVQPLDPLERHEAVYLAIDFNVFIQATSVWVRRGGQFQCVRQHKGFPDTETLADFLAAEYKGHRMLGFPDPAGRQRKTSAAVGRTDFSILESRGIKIHARSAAPSIKDSAMAVNRQLHWGNMFVDPSCEDVIKSLERTKWLKGDSAMIDKSESIEHFSDGIRYMTDYLCPYEQRQKHYERGFTF